MSKAMYLNVDGKAKKTKKMYINVGGVAKKVKKAYLNVNGIARLFFGGKELKYKGPITGLSVARGYVRGASVGNYMLFAGGYNGSSTSYSTVDAYTPSFVRSTPTSLSYAVHHFVGISVGAYALFAGGYRNNYASRSSVVNTYNASLTKGTATALSSNRGGMASANVGDYAVIAGGYPICDTVEAYNSSLTKSSVTKLSQAREFMAGATNGKHAIFAGGQNDGGGTTYANVDAYDASLTKVSVAEFSKSFSRYSGASFGQYAVFDVNWATTFYDQSLTKVYTDVSHGGYWDGTGVGFGDEYVVFGSWQEIKSYDKSFTRQLFSRSDLSSGVYGLGSASVGDSLIIAGGNTVTNAVALQLS